MSNIQLHMMCQVILMYSNMIHILNRLDMLYEQECIATPRDEYYTKMLKTLIDHKDCHNTPFSSEKLQQAVGRVMA